MKHPWMPLDGVNYENDQDLPVRFWGYDGQPHPERITAAGWRAYRLRRARRAGTHTKKEWIDLLASAKGCALCGVSVPKFEKDHIIPISKGGCDCIRNIQPVCRECNSRKGGRVL